MNDYVKDEFRPNDLKHTWNKYGFKGQSTEATSLPMNKMYNEKIWE